MVTEAALIIGAATGLVSASASAFVAVSKELRAWRQRPRARPAGATPQNASKQLTS
jgi:hypothetical protein